MKKRERKCGGKGGDFEIVLENLRYMVEIAAKNPEIKLEIANISHFSGRICFFWVPVFTGMTKYLFLSLMDWNLSRNPMIIKVNMLK